MWQKEEKALETKGVNWDKFELFARQVRYPFLMITIGTFIATNLKAFQDNKVGMWLFFASGIFWMVSAAYIEIRDQVRFANRLRLENSGEMSFNHRSLGRNKMVRWLRNRTTIIGIFVVLAAAIALYLIPSNPSKPSWGLVLVALGPAAMWLTNRVQRKGRDNENLIRQLGPLVKDAEDLEFTIRSFARDLLSKTEVQTEIGGGLGVQGWSNYIESNGAWQLCALSSLKTDLKEADPFEHTQVINVITSFYQILGRVLELESRLVAVCQKIMHLPQGTQSNWDYIQHAHQRLSTQLSSLKPILNEMERGDLFDTFINQPPQNLKPTT